MTNLFKQCHTWFKQKKWDKIIRAVEKIKPKARPLELSFMLAAAYLRSSNGWKDRKDSKKALDILLSLEYALDGTVPWYLFVGQALENLERFAEAAQYYEDALEITDKEEDQRLLGKLIDKSRDNSHSLSFTQSFSSRVAQAWEEFLKREVEYRNILDKDTERKRTEELEAKVTAVFEIALTNTKVVVGKTENKYQLGFIGDNRLLRLFEELYIKDRAPAEVLEHWKIVVGGAPIGDSDPPESSSDELQLWFKKDDYGLLNIDAYTKTLWKPKPNEVEKVVNIALITGYLITLVGEAVVAKYVNTIELVEEPSKGKSILAHEVPEFFKSQGIDFNVGTEAILEKLVTYEGVSQGWDDDKEFREDVISGASKATKTLEDYRNFEFKHFFELEADGAIVCTLYYENESFVGEDREKKISEYRQAVEKELVEKAGSESVKILGYAHGEFWEYIDMIAWDPKKVFETADAIAEKSPIERFAFHISNPSASTYFLKGNFSVGEPVEPSKEEKTETPSSNGDDQSNKS